MICNKCKHHISDDSEFCQYCGNTISTAPTTKKKKNKRLGKVVLISALSLILAAAIAFGGLYFWKTQRQSPSDNTTENSYMEKVVVVSGSKSAFLSEVEELNAYLSSGWTIKSITTETTGNGSALAIFVIKKNS